MQSKVLLEVDRSVSVLKIDNLVYRWPKASRDTLRIDELSLAPGERLFLHGPSGCGKSTLLSAIAGVVAVPTGTVFVTEQDVGRLRGGARDRFRVDHIGLIFQVLNLVPWLSALETVLLPGRYSKRWRARSKASPRLYCAVSWASHSDLQSWIRSSALIDSVSAASAASPACLSLPA